MQLRDIDLCAMTCARVATNWTCYARIFLLSGLPRMDPGELINVLQRCGSLRHLWYPFALYNTDVSPRMMDDLLKVQRAVPCVQWHLSHTPRDCFDAMPRSSRADRRHFVGALGGAASGEDEPDNTDDEYVTDGDSEPA
jgi:hypothetical protein